MTDFNKIAEKAALYQEDMWEFIRNIVSIDSGEDNPEGIAEVAKLTARQLEKAGFAAETALSAGPVNLIARRPAPGRPQVLIIGHMDTVFPRGTAAARPFHIKDGMAYGPGVMDMKSGIGITVCTLRALHECGFDGADITVLLAGDEENNHTYSEARSLLARYAAGKDAVFNMEPGRENGEIVCARKGVWRPLIKVKGIAAHSGNDYEKGASAILELARKTADIFALTDLEAGTTYNVGVVCGGTLPNIMAENASAKLDIRFTTVSEAEKAREKLRALCSHNYDERTRTELAEESPGDYMPPFEATEAGLRLCRFVQKQHESLGFGRLEAVSVGGSSDAAYTTIAGAPTVCAMGPQSAGAHSGSEFAVVASCLPRCLLLASCIVNIGEFVSKKNKL